MLTKGAQGVLCAVALGALTYFYATRSSECVKSPTSYGCPGHTKQEPNHVFQTEKADDRIANYTLWLAILTGALVVVSFVQIRFLVRADENARNAASFAERSLIETQRALIAPKQFIVNILFDESIIGYRAVAILHNTGNTQPSIA
jgi:hypothetical protein